ncbi:MAG: alpha/beta fold hydrolase [Meiothermus sp.]|nr:alpha/beta fold hydrolase [Meiothermus sp.]
MSTPVIFLHAFPYSPAMWEEQVKSVGDRPALVPDILGLETLEAAAAQVLLEMDDRGWEKAVFVGLSMGGYVMFRLWNLQPERVAAMLLADTRATPDTPEGRARRHETAAKIEAGGMAAFVPGAIESNLGQTTKTARLELLEHVRQTLLHADPHKTVISLRALATRPDSLPLLPSISVPTLVVVGDEDTLTPPSDAWQMAAAIPRSQLVVVPRAGHMSNLENPSVFNAALLGFLAGLG